MAQYETLRNYQLENAAEDVRGSHLYGVNDEKLRQNHGCSFQ